MIEIDGSSGEGGGQVLRSSLTLSLIKLRPFRIHDIRAGRKTPGLRPQHLKAVLAAAEVSEGTVTAAEIGSTVLEFYPRSVKPGKYSFNIGTAGSISLLLQTILIPLAMADGKSIITVIGGTHVPWSPCYHFLDMHWMPYLSQMGINIQLSLELAGYYPRGGGKVKANIEPHGQLKPLNLDHRGKVIKIRGLSSVSNLSRKIAERQRNRVIKRLGSKYPLNDIRIKNLPSNNKGTMMLLIVECEYSRACFFGLGAPGKPAEKVADEAIDAVLDYLATDRAVDPFTSDQLLLPMTLTQAPSMMKTSEITNHLLTNAMIIERFLPVEIKIDGEIGFPGTVMIKPNK